MRNIHIITPLERPHFFGKLAAVDMETEQELARVSPGETMIIPAKTAIDLGIAWVRLGAPAVRLRFMAQPGKTYVLHWQKTAFGSGMGLEEQ